MIKDKSTSEDISYYVCTLYYSFNESVNIDFHELARFQFTSHAPSTCLRICENRQVIEFIYSHYCLYLS